MLKKKDLFTLFGRRVLLVCSALALLMVLFAGIQSRPAFAASWAFVRILHASPDAGIVDVFMDGSKLLSNFQYGTLTDYTPVVAGSHDIQVAVIGTGTSAAILSQTLSLQAGTPYTVVALGTQSTGFTLHVFADNNGIAGNLAKVRVYHMSPGIGTVDVDSDGHTLISGLPYAQASNYVSISPGPYTFNVLATQGNANSPISLQLKPWTVTSIFAISSLTNGSSSKNLQFVQSQITGIPGMPGTGSDPHALPIAAPPQSRLSIAWPWTLLVLAMLVACIGTITLSRRAKGKLFSRER